MDKKVLKEIAEQLEEEKQSLEKKLNQFTTKDKKVKDNYWSEFPDYGNDEDENANEVAAYSDRLSIEHTLEKQLRDVNQALKNIKKGSYGICQHCQKPIEEKRLLVRPTSSSCVACKKKLKGEV